MSARETLHRSTPSLIIRGILADFHSCGGLVGEDRNIVKLFFCIVSKYLPRRYRNHAIIVSSSAAGKTTLANTVTLPFTSSLLNYTRVTGAALDRFDQNLDGKIFLYQQAHGDEPYQFKPILTEGKLSILVAEKDSQTKRFTSTEHEVHGIPVFIATTTDPNLDPELLNRALIITLDESREQTRRIISHRAKQAATVDVNHLGSWSLISKITLRLEGVRHEEIQSIVIPFAEKFAETLPDEPIELRRDVGKVLNLVAAIAYTKSLCYRGFYEVSKIKGVTQKVIVAEPEDLDDALWCMGDDWLLQLPYTAKKILEYLKTQVKGEKDFEGYRQIPYKDIFIATGIPRSTGTPYLRLLESKGLVTVSKAEAGNANLYQYQPNERLANTIDLSSYNAKTWISEKLPDAVFKEIEDPIRRVLIGANSDRQGVEGADTTGDGFADSTVDNPVTTSNPSTPTASTEEDKTGVDLGVFSPQNCPDANICGYRGVFIGAKQMEEHRQEHHKGEMIVGE